MAFAELREKLRDARRDRDEVARALHAARETLRTLEARETTLDRLGGTSSDEYAELIRRKKELEVAITDLRANLEGLQSLVDELEAEFAPEAVPQSGIINLSDRFPILLFPVRLETRFGEVLDPRTGDRQIGLWLRIYPDDIQIETHEDLLTGDEVASAESYWQAVWRAGGERERERGAWRALVQRYGAPRAAWIVRAYRPNNEFDENGNSNRPPSPIPDDQPLKPLPAFDPYDPKQDSWSQAPRVTTMPDRFVALGFVGGKPVFEAIGNPIPQPLIVGPDPSHPENAGEGFTADGDELSVDAEMRWMVDFEEAVRVGMGMRIPLPRESSDRVDRLLVIGLRLAADAAEAGHELEALIEAHHYAADGFSLVPIGTPTNSTDSDTPDAPVTSADADESFEVELGSPRFTVAVDWKERRDGQYLADALGIDPAVLQHVGFSDGLDQRDARAMNRALWPATLGFYLEEMLHPLVDQDTLSQTYDFLIEHVTGRGTVPSIRAGAQPYGILPTSSWRGWRWPADPGDEKSRFRQGRYDLIMRFDAIWTTLSEQVSQVRPSSNSEEQLMDVLGLHPSSAEFHQRFASGLDHLSNLLKIRLRNSSAMAMPPLLEQSWSGLLEALGTRGLARPDLFWLLWHSRQVTLDGPIVDELPPSESRGLQPLSQDEENYLTWLASSPIDSIRRQDFGHADDANRPAPNALLYLLLRQAVMNAYWDAAWHFWAQVQPSQPPRKEPPFLYVQTAAPEEGKFSLLYQPAGVLHSVIPEVFKDPTQIVAERISDADLIRDRPETQGLRRVREALDLLRERPTAKLKRALCEHIDLCHYRLDAWKQGLASERLSELRSMNGGEGHGIYLGAFGWLEEVRPKASLSEHTGDLPPEFKEETPLMVASGNQGYIHGPSLNHAVTAAVLRNAYITRGDPDHASVAAVNLTSERVRTALTLLEGIREGQELGALLGYQFERGLHDRYDVAEVDQFIFPLRKHFPLVAKRLSTAQPGTPIAALEARNVIDGLAFVRHVQNVGNRIYPFSLSDSDLPPASASQKAAMSAEAERLENALDALSDLMVAESVFHAVRGNHERAAAVMDAMSKAEAVPEVEIVRTPRSGFALTHRLCLQIDAAIVGTARNPFPGTIPLTPRAAAEPGLNTWLAGVLGDPAGIGCQVMQLTEGGDGSASETPHVATLQELRIQPIDLIYVVGESLGGGQSELDQRLAYAVRQREGLAAAARLRVDYSAPVVGGISLFELMPLLRALRGVVLQSRPLHAQDLVLPNDQAADLDQAASPDPNPKGWNPTDLAERVEAARLALAAVDAGLQSAITRLAQPDPTPQAFADLRAGLLAASAFGIQQSLPASAIEADGPTARALIDQADAVRSLIGQRLAACDQLLPVPDEASIDQAVDTWVAAGRHVLGPDFLWLPHFALKLPDEMERAHADSAHILRHLTDSVDFPAEEWLHGVARVRPRAEALERTMLLSDAFGTSVPQLTPLQLPHHEGDFWLAMQYPAGHALAGDRLLVTTAFAAPFAKSQPQAGLLIDEWVEVVPRPDQTTGIAFHYDAPSSEPPQTLLLAVTPELTGAWQWDHLVATLNETLDEAKKRAVEPEQLDRTVLARLLPAVLVPTARYQMSATTNLLSNVGMPAELPPDSDGVGR